MCLGLSHRFFEFRSQDEIIFSQAIDAVGEDFHADFAPGEIDVGMVADFLSDGADFVREVEGTNEVFELEELFEVVIIHDLPIGTEFMV